MMTEEKLTTQEERDKKRQIDLGQAVIIGFIITYLISPIYITIGWNWGLLKICDYQFLHEINLMTAVCLVLLVKGVVWTFKSQIPESRK